MHFWMLCVFSVFNFSCFWVFYVIVFIRYGAPQRFPQTYCVSGCQTCCCEWGKGWQPILKMNKSLNFVITCLNEFVQRHPKWSLVLWSEGPIMVQIENVHLWQWHAKEMESICFLSGISNEMTLIQENMSVLLSCVVICW